ncbi:MAG TPA: GGDEF domain-containing protein, partial [Candidatus Limnocylindrales bacterium]|nr:GGDEF domain-containing protein [Candidatus Limnocylindrales bacterium]
MTIDAVLAVSMVAVLAALALAAAVPGRMGGRVRGRLLRSGRRAAETRAPAADTSSPGADADHDAVRYVEPGEPSDLRPAALDRIIRVGTWVFLFAVTTLVAVTDLWGDRQGPILVLLGLGGLYTFVLHEVIPPRVPDTLLFIVEGALSVGFVVVLIAMTGGATSPFFFALPLIVVGAATVIPQGITLALTAGAGAAYLVAVLAGDPVIDPAWLSTVAINLTALGLIAYVGMAIGREQRRAREDANRLATLDPLTGLRTRAAMFNALERELARSQRTGRAFCLLMIDMDDLKGINDRLGHLVGDRALRHVGDVVRARIRRIDTGARFGGDEFVVLLPETDPTGGWVLAEKIRQGVAADGPVVDGTRIPTSVSVGLVTYPADGETVGALLERADEAMYRSKRTGRDRVTGVPVM